MLQEPAHRQPLPPTQHRSVPIQADPLQIQPIGADRSRMRPRHQPRPTRDDYLIAGHITAWIDGGSYDLDNERTECRKCSNSGGGDLAAQRNAEAKANAGAATPGSLRARGAREGRTLTRYEDGQLSPATKEPLCLACVDAQSTA